MTTLKAQGVSKEQKVGLDIRNPVQSHQLPNYMLGIFNLEGEGIIYSLSL